MNRYLIGNEITVDVSEGLNLEKVDIYEGTDERVHVFRKGNFANNISRIYGGPYFTVYYDSKCLAHAGHWRTNDWYVNSYSFHIHEKDGTKTMKFSVSGPSNKCNDFFQIFHRIDDLIVVSAYDTDHKLMYHRREHKSIFDSEYIGCKMPIQNGKIGR